MNGVLENRNVETDFHEKMTIEVITAGCRKFVQKIATKKVELKLNMGHVRRPFNDGSILGVECKFSWPSP